MTSDNGAAILKLQLLLFLEHQNDYKQPVIGFATQLQNKIITFAIVQGRSRMDIKKFIIQISCIFAGIFLLAHAILPHIHHDGIVCFIEEQTQHCTDGCENTKVDHHANHHHHDESLEDCNLKDLVIRQDNADTQLTQYLSPDFLSLYYLIYPLSKFYLDTPSLALWLKQKPYSETYITPLTDSIKSLRAPPASSFLG